MGPWNLNVKQCLSQTDDHFAHRSQPVLGALPAPPLSTAGSTDSPAEGRKSGTRSDNGGNARPETRADCDMFP